MVEKMSLLFLMKNWKKRKENSRLIQTKGQYVIFSNSHGLYFFCYLSML